MYIQPQAQLIRISRARVTLGVLITSSGTSTCWRLLPPHVGRGCHRAPAPAIYAREPTNIAISYVTPASHRPSHPLHTSQPRTITRSRRLSAHGVCPALQAILHVAAIAYHTASHYNPSEEDGALGRRRNESWASTRQKLHPAYADHARTLLSSTLAAGLTTACGPTPSGPMKARTGIKKSTAHK